LTIEQVRLLHRYALEQHGGQDGLRDAAAFESAVMQPRNVWLYAQGDVFDVAAAYAFHLAESQAFVDGNKRTGMGCALVFLECNGFSVTANTEVLHAMMINIAKRCIGKAQVAEILRALCAH
jgi:death-on-curing protein